MVFRVKIFRNLKKALIITTVFSEEAVDFTLLFIACCDHINYGVVRWYYPSIVLWWPSRDINSI